MPIILICSHKEQFKIKIDEKQKRHEKSLKLFKQMHF